MAYAEGTVSRLVKAALADGVRKIRFGNFGSLAAMLVEDDLTELARAGRRFYGGTQALGNGMAPVTTIPTTTATAALVNPDPNKSYVIGRLNVFLGTGTPAAGLTLMGTIVRPTDAVFMALSPTANWAVANCNPGSSAKSLAFWTVTLTLPGAPVWAAMTSNLQPAAANLGQGDAPGDERGGWIVPPRHVLGLAVLSGAGTTPLYSVSARWTELEIENE